MKTFTIILLALITSCAASKVHSTSKSNSFILKNINIVDVENQQILTSKTVTVQNGKISNIAPTHEATTTSNLTVVNGNNGYITPGLIDMHVHMYEKAAYLFTLSHGVTHVRVMNGVPKQLIWRNNIKSGKQIGSTSTVSSPILSGYKNTYLHHTIETADQAKQAVQQYKLQGYDLIKAYGNLNEEALLGVLQEAKKINMPVAKHGPHGSGNIAWSQLNELQSFEHVEDIYQGLLNHTFSTEKLPQIIKQLKATNVPITPTLNIYHQLTKLSQHKNKHLKQTPKHYTSSIIALEASQNQVKRWVNASEKMAAHNQKVLSFLQYITKQLHKAGVPLLVGSDSGVLLSPHGLATHNEIQLLQAAGISAYSVLAAATINPAKALELSNQIGKIATHYNADFIYSTTNPITDLSVLKNPEAVIKSGHWYTQKQLAQMREQAIESRSIWEELFVLFEGL